MMREESWEELCIRAIFLRPYYVVRVESVYVLQEFRRFKQETRVPLRSLLEAFK